MLHVATPELTWARHFPVILLTGQFYWRTRTVSLFWEQIITLKHPTCKRTERANCTSTLHMAVVPLPLLRLLASSIFVKICHLLTHTLHLILSFQFPNSVSDSIYLQMILTIQLSTVLCTPCAFCVLSSALSIFLTHKLLQETQHLNRFLYEHNILLLFSISLFMFLPFQKQTSLILLAISCIISPCSVATLYCVCFHIKRFLYPGWPN